jgi:hypothetical protein
VSFFNKAVERLAQNSEYIVREGVISWKDSNSLSQPTEAEIDAEIIRLQAEYDAQAYARKREAEYPSVQECVHAILDDDLDALQAKRADIKTKYPKG